MLKIGLDVGSTTLKCVALGSGGEILYRNYQRHLSRISEMTGRMLAEVVQALPQGEEAALCVSGSAGMGLAQQLGLPFEQEVFATKQAVAQYAPGSDCVIELGGEDAKILFLTGLTEVRMNGSCAGGTGAFIDQMATLLGVEPGELDQLAGRYEKIYSIASRCGVFAKSDIQPLLNQGARREDIAASIFAAVVNQTIAGLAQGREIGGRVLYLGGPLTFLPQLRAAFDRALGLDGLCPDNSLYYVALGAALGAQKPVDLEGLARQVAALPPSQGYVSCPPLFKDQGEYRAFVERHRDRDRTGALGPDKAAYVGIDAGSTTVKAVVIDGEGRIVFSRYLPGKGNPVPMVKQFLLDMYEKFPGIQVRGAAATGYGEEIIKNAFQADLGMVETIAHFTAARAYDPQVDFIIDIGGQDIKCFKIKNGAIDNIFLNEACSSGCGSFLQTFAGALGYSVEDFARMGLLADRPVDLGSRCTVFMNSQVKQAQKDGATTENISAGLSISVVKNALYKVIRVSGPQGAPSLGEHIVVQGGTFLNDAVLRAFEMEIGREVTRPGLAGLMGAYGAALYVREHPPVRSALLGPEQLQNFVHQVKAATCNGCTNHCRLTINTFAGGRRFIGGNQCEKPVSGGQAKEHYSLYDEKRRLLSRFGDVEGKKPVIGIPLVLNMYELLPFWHTFFRALGYGIRVSPPSSRKLYLRGQNSIPSDTACYPAKLVHGHVATLIDRGVDAVFYPCMSYNLEEGLGDNHYNCPVVAYYPEVIGGNMKELAKVQYIKCYLGPHRRRDFPRKIGPALEPFLGHLDPARVKDACRQAYAAQDQYMDQVRRKGEEYLALARQKNLPVILLAGRPYHLDGEVNHGIDKFICQAGAVLLSEDSLGRLYSKHPTRVLNQWTYHARLYAAAELVAASGNPRMNLVQLVSFGCGVDAITGDEVRAILERAGRIYTQIKIDEITNLGAVKIRLRSLFAATGTEGGSPYDQD